MTGKKGFSLVEVIIASAVLVLLIGALGSGILYTQIRTALAGDRIRAVLLAEEGMEAVRNIRDDDFSLLTDGQHGLSSLGPVWDFSGASDTTGIYTRTISIATPSTNTKHVTTTVTWLQNSFIPGKVELVGEFTNWQAPGVGNWAAPSEESSYNLAGGGGVVYRLALRDNLVYAPRLGGTPRFTIVDITNPASPQLVGSLPGEPPYGGLRGISLSGNYAYVISSDANRELQVINITNPSAPSYVTAVNLPSNLTMQGITVSGQYLYLTRNVNAGAGMHEFFVYSIANPAAPSFVGSMNYSGSASALMGINVIGSYAFVATNVSTSGLLVINVANPAAPSVASSLTTGFSAGNPIVSYSSTLILGFSSTALRFVNAANPLIPVLQGSVTGGTGNVSGLSLGVNNNYVFAATSNSSAEFRVARACNPTAPAWLGLFSTPFTLYDIAYSATLDRAVVGTADANKELLIIKPQ